MRCLIVHNTTSGFGSDAVYAFMRSIAHPGDDCVLRVLDDTFDPKRAVADAEDFDEVVVSGGDGTVSSLLYALRDRAVTTCVFPSGTANLLFSDIGNSPEPAALARACRVGSYAETDLGEISWTDASGTEHTRGFAMMAGSGFDAEIMAAAAPNKRAMGEAAYFMAALSDPKPCQARYVLDIDGERIERDGIACLVANNAMIQGNIEIVPDCRMDDGLLDVIILEAGDRSQLIRPIVAGLLDPKGKGLGRPRIERFRGRDITMGCDQPIPMQVDGEVVEGTVTSWKARVLPRANRLIVDDLSRYAGTADDHDARFPVPEEIAYPEA